MIDAKLLSALVRTAVVAVALVCFPQISEGGQAAMPPPAATPPSQLKVFLDCRGCFADFLRAEVTFVDYVRDRVEADVHVLISQLANALRVGLLNDMVAGTVPPNLAVSVRMVTADRAAKAPRPEEILLRLRQLRSGYEYNFGVNMTYSFGSIFSSIVNRRFGQ